VKKQLAGVLYSTVLGHAVLLSWFSAFDISKNRNKNVIGNLLRYVCAKNDQNGEVIAKIKCYVFYSHGSALL